MLIDITQHSYIHTKTGEVCKRITDKIDILNPQEILVENFEYNTLKGVLKRNEWKPTLGDWLPLYDGMYWNEKKGIVEDLIYIPEIKKVSFEDLIEAAQSFFMQFEGRHLGVQLSGGLDSSIIICLLSYLKIPFSLVGMCSDRFEFRTERKIQEILYELGQKTVLIDYEDFLPFSNILDVPQHPYPDMISNNYSTEKIMAQYCHELGIEVLLSGGGGDNVFGEEVTNLWELKPQVFVDEWSKNFVYAAHGVEIRSFYAEKEIIDCLYNLRFGQKEDNAKIWARNAFKDILPQQLVNYTYCADFWGLYISGLHNALPDLQFLFEEVYRLTQFKSFSSEAISDLLSQDYLNAKKEKYQKIESRIAFAIWLYSNLKNG